MTDFIVETSENVTLIGAGKVNKGILADALVIAPYLIAADGGAKLALNYGKTPKKVIGDFDSLDGATLAGFPAGDVHRIKEQDTTDFDKCLRSIKAPLVLGVGFMGSRTDHELAAFNSLVRHSEQRCILIGKGDIVFHLPKTLAIDLAPDTRVSLFPMAAVSGSSKGLEWPIAGLNFSPGGRIGTSNRATSGKIVLEMDGPGMLAILPRAALSEAAVALTSK